MELLIPGLILVALMVYASTRIKRSAARAFEAETVETDDFVIQKPDGFLNVINGDSKFAFESYSKDFGGGGSGNIRMATVTVVVRIGVSVNDAANEILMSGGETSDNRNEKSGEIVYRIIERRRCENDIDFIVRSKLAERNGKLFIFTLQSIAETTPDFMLNIEAMFDSFELK